MNKISIHAPRVGSDIRFPARLEAPSLFQSTLPVWGATIRYKKHKAHRVFQSTLPVWGATKSPGNAGRMEGISIHAPRVGSDCWMIISGIGYGAFQSTLPVWGATILRKNIAQDKDISIHAPRVGSDSVEFEELDNDDISIHAPRVGSD